MRLFITIPAPEDIKNKAAEFQKRFLNLPVKWLVGKNLHITLIPPWEESDLKSARNKFKNFNLKIKSFEIDFKEISFGPNLKQPRLIWVKGETSLELINLKIECEKNLYSQESEVALPTLRRDFLPHLTLARFRPEDFKKFPVKNLNVKILWKDTVNSVVLMQSYLSPNGADYEILEEIKLINN